MDHLEKLQQCEKQLNSYKKFMVSQPPEFFDSEWYLLLENEMQRLRDICHNIRNERLYMLNRPFPEWQLYWPSIMNDLQEELL